jgi:hypothetical protein
MEYFYVEPEVAGALGERTIMDRSVHPPLVERLHYQLEGWLGDPVLESFPAFILTQDTKETLLRMGATGATFDDVEVTVSDQFRELYPGRNLPRFVWLKPEGRAGRADIGTAADGRLVVSRPVLDAFGSLGMSHALVEPFGGEGSPA